MQVAENGLQLKEEMMKQIFGPTFKKQRDKMLNDFFVHQRQLPDFDPKFTEALMMFSKNQP